MVRTKLPHFQFYCDKSPQKNDMLQINFTIIKFIHYITQYLVNLKKTFFFEGINHKKKREKEQKHPRSAKYSLRESVGLAVTRPSLER